MRDLNNKEIKVIKAIKENFGRDMRYLKEESTYSTPITVLSYIRLEKIVEEIQTNANLLVSYEITLHPVYGEMIKFTTRLNEE